MMISSLRKEKAMTQAQLAEKMNITDKAVSKWERDLSYPDISSLSKLSEILGVTVDDLIQAKESVAKESNSEKVKKLVNLILRAIALAMGVSVVVLSVLKGIKVNASITLLGIGLTCMAIGALEQRNDK